MPAIPDTVTPKRGSGKIFMSSTSNPAPFAPLNSVLGTDPIYGRPAESVQLSELLRVPVQEWIENVRQNGGFFSGDTGFSGPGPGESHNPRIPIASKRFLQCRTSFRFILSSAAICSSWAPASARSNTSARIWICGRSGKTTNAPRSVRSAGESVKSDYRSNMSFI